jgi:fucose permease
MFVIYLWISIGAIFIILGVFDLLIDRLGVPRGVVFSLGGILISLIAVIFLQAAKIKKTRR